MFHGRTQMCYVFFTCGCIWKPRAPECFIIVPSNLHVFIGYSPFSVRPFFFWEDGSEVCTTPAAWECVGGFSSIPTSIPWICRTIQARQPYTGQVLLASVLKFSKILPLRHCIAAGPENSGRLLVTNIPIDQSRFSTGWSHPKQHVWVIWPKKIHTFFECGRMPTSERASSLQLLTGKTYPKGNLPRSGLDKSTK